MSFVEGITVVDAKTFRLKLKEPTGLLVALGKPSSNVPFMMPKRVAETDPNTQISDFTGSGPFVFKRDEWKAGDKAVYVKFDKYKPRSEPASGMAGGKIVKVDRVEWRAICDYQHGRQRPADWRNRLHRAAAARSAPSHEVRPECQVVEWNPFGNQFMFRSNHLDKPFDNTKVRQALWYAFNQEDFLEAVIGDPDVLQGLQGVVSVRHADLATEAGHGGSAGFEFQKAETFSRRPAMTLRRWCSCTRPTSPLLTNLAPVAKR